MFGSVKTQPNHYETLGLTPSATGEDIAKAFATRLQIRVSSPEEADDHALRLFAAYEALRDPFSRQIYDAEIGVASGSTFNGDRESAVEHRVAPFIAAALRDPLERNEDDTPANFILLPDPEDLEPTVEQNGEPLPAEHGLVNPREDARVVAGPHHRRSEWNKAGAGTGAVVLGLGLLTLLAGLFWGNVDRQSMTSLEPTAAVPQKTAPPLIQPAQNAPQSVLPTEPAPQLPPDMAATAFSPVTVGDIAPVSTSGGAVMSSSTTNATGEIEIAEGAGSGSETVTRSVDPQTPATPAASVEGDDPLAPAPPVSQAAPAAVAQVAAPAPPRPAAIVNRSAPARLISGSLVKADNPRGQFRGTVTVRFIVQPNGQISGCRAAVSSGNSALDARTCRLIEQRLRFAPALDAQGRAVPSETRATYTWGVKHRPLLKRLLGWASR